MAKYGVFLKPTTLDRMVVVKTTVGSPADGDWDSQDGEVDFKGKAVKSLWAQAHRPSTSVLDEYIFDASDAGPNDPGGVWAGDNNAFTDNAGTGTTSTSGSVSADYLEGEGTNAPSSGTPIISVRLRVRAKGGGGGDATLGLRVTTDAVGETLLSTTQALTSSVVDYIFSVTEPSGGWTYAKLQALEIRYWRDSGADTLFVERGLAQALTDTIQVVTQQENGKVAYHLFDPGTDTWIVKDETVVVVGSIQFDAIPGNFAVSLAVRSDGDVVLVAAYNDIPNESVRAFTRQGGSWTNEGEASGGEASTNYAGVVIIGPDGSDRVSWVYKDLTNGDVDLKSMASDDSFSGITTIDTAVDTATILVAPGVIDSADKIYLPYIDADGQLSIASWTSGAFPTVSVDTTLTVRDVFGQGRTAPAYAVGCMALDGTDAHLVYYDDVDKDIYHEDDVDGATGSDTLIESFESSAALWAWGKADLGQLGDGSVVDKSSPIQIGVLVNWTGVSSGELHSLAVKTDGTLWAWGEPDFGKLGNGTTTPDISSPVQIGALTDWASVAGGHDHSLSIKTDNTLWAYGNNFSGPLGDGSNTNRSSPVQVGALMDWASVTAGEGFSIAVKTDNTLWAWGFANNGRLGNGTTTPNLSSPVQIGALTDWASASAGESHSISIKTDGTLWAWGDAANGRLGDGTTTAKSSPVQIGSLTDWASVSAGFFHSLAIKTDGTLWAWGSASNGKLGNGTTTPNLSSPVQIGTLTDWASVSAGSSHSHAVKTDGTLWAWGDAANGRLGDGTTTAKSSPVQIGALTNWSGISVGGSHSLALKSETLTDFHISANVIA